MAAPSRCGFTLVEVMVAVGLSLFIILMSASAIRTASSTINVARTRAQENELLRAGVRMALDDGDFWHSLADPSLPYDRGPESLPLLDLAKARRKVPFAPVHFFASTASTIDGFDATVRTAGGRRSDGTLANPAALLPHDPRAWFCNHPTPAWTIATANAPFTLNPWSAAQMHGPYHLLGATDMRGTGSYAGDYRYPALAGIDYRQLQYRPNLMLRLYQRLGDHGLIDYLPNGTSWLVLDQRGRVPDATSNPTHPFQTVSATDGNVFEFGFRWTTYNGAGGYEGFRNRRVAEDFPGLMALRIEAFGDNSGTDNMQALRWLGLPDDTVDNPFQSISSVTNNRQGDRTWKAQNTVFTVRLPYNRTNRFDDLDGKPLDLPLLTTSLLRYDRLAGSDLVLHRIVLEDPTGRRLILPFQATHTTYRGARQHWGVIGAELGLAMGDIYVR